MQINVNEQLALMSVTLFVLIEASCSVATVRIHLLELDQALCERAGNETAWCTNRMSTRVTARLLRSCSIARANVRCTISFPSTCRSCIPSYMHHDALSQRVFSKRPHRLRARTLMALNRSVLNPTTHTQDVRISRKLTYFLFYFLLLLNLGLKIVEYIERNILNFYK